MDPFLKISCHFFYREVSDKRQLFKGHLEVLVNIIVFNFFLIKESLLLRKHICISIIPVFFIINLPALA